jgi:hypothetical protein
VGTKRKADSVLPPVTSLAQIAPKKTCKKAKPAESNAQDHSNQPYKLSDFVQRLEELMELKNQLDPENAKIALDLIAHKLLTHHTEEISRQQYELTPNHATAFSQISPNVPPAFMDLFCLNDE